MAFLNINLRAEIKGLIIEKESSIYGKDGFTRKDVEQNIFANPFERFEDMRFMKRCREIEYVELNRHIFRKLTRGEIEWVLAHCYQKLDEYYKKRTM